MGQSETSATPDLQDRELLRDTIESLLDGIAIYGPDRRLIAHNSKYVEMLGPVADHVAPGVSWEELLRAATEAGVYATPPQEVHEWLARLEENPGREVRNFEVSYANGRVYSSRYHPTRTGGFVIRRTDITERKQAEERLRESEHLLKTVLDTIPIPIVMARKEDGRIIYRSAEAWKDYDADKPFAQDHFQDPADRARYVREIEAHGKVPDFRVDLRRADGSYYRATLAGRLVEHEGDSYVVSAISDLSAQLSKEELLRHVVEACPTPLTMTKLESSEILFSSSEARALFGDEGSARVFYVDPTERVRYVEELRRTGHVLDYRVRLRAVDGREFWAAISARTITYGGEVVSVAHVRDLTEQLSIEEQLATQREMIFQNEKMSAFGELLAGVAHELNNPLSVVVGHALMLLEDEADPEVRRHVEKISAASERCARIVRTFLTMARQQPARTEPTDVNEIIRTAVDVARYGDTHDVRLESDLAEGLPMIPADPDQITQVLLNLIINAEQAIHASGQGDLIRVTSRGGPGTDTVELVVEDNGPGVPPAIHGRIFDPFFTTKDVGKGTGIGLALSHRVVHSHNGSIRLDPRCTTGSRFVISLPVAHVDAAAATKVAPETESLAAARVLVVDDELDVAELNGEILSRGGYRVDVTNSVTRAIALLREGDYDLVLSDLNMPEHDGRHLFETIGREFPHLTARTAFVTGDTMGQASQSFLSETKRPYIEKPVAPHELLAFAGGVLDALQGKR